MVASIKDSGRMGNCEFLILLSFKYGCGRQYWQNGTFYEGYWVYNMFEGRGRLVHNDGNIYEGDFIND